MKPDPASMKAAAEIAEQAARDIQILVIEPTGILGKYVSDMVPIIARHFALALHSARVEERQRLREAVANLLVPNPTTNYCDARYNMALADVLHLLEELK